MTTLIIFFPLPSSTPSSPCSSSPDRGPPQSCPSLRQVENWNNGIWPIWAHRRDDFERLYLGKPRARGYINGNGAMWMALPRQYWWNFYLIISIITYIHDIRSRCDITRIEKPFITWFDSFQRFKSWVNRHCRNFSNIYIVQAFIWHQCNFCSFWGFLDITY